MKHSNSAYKDAGVDIEAAAELIERIKPHIKKTERAGVMGSVGGFGALFDLKKTGYEDPVLVSATDGVGTKIKVAIEIDRHDTIGIDLVAMCVNDLVVQGAEPLFFLDYFATGKLVNTVAEDVIKGVAEGCRQAGCALIGGETAEMPGLYATGEYDLAGFSVGAVERNQILTGESIADGDVILGLASNGIHSNGFSLVRKLIKAESEYTYDSPAPFDNALSLGELILMPTRIYVQSIMAVLKQAAAEDKVFVKGLAHITGGGLYENIPRVLPKGVTAHVDAKSWTLPPIFKFLADVGGLNPHDMARTLNCGIGMAVICPADQAQTVKSIFESHNETVYEIGEIKSASHDDEDIVLHNLDEAWS